MEDDPQGEAAADEAEARREQIRGWYAEAKALGLSEDDFYREMTPIVGDEEIEIALDEMQDDAGSWS